MSWRFWWLQYEGHIRNFTTCGWANFSLKPIKGAQPIAIVIKQWYCLVSQNTPAKKRVRRWKWWTPVSTFEGVLEKFRSEAPKNKANLILFLADKDPSTSLSWCPGIFFIFYFYFFGCLFSNYIWYVEYVSRVPYN